jgi:hypothetical protein
VRRVACRRCGKVKRERLEFLADNPLYTKRFANYVGQRRRPHRPRPDPAGRRRCLTLRRNGLSEAWTATLSDGLLRLESKELKAEELAGSSVLNRAAISGWTAWMRRGGAWCHRYA